MDLRVVEFIVAIVAIVTIAIVAVIVRETIRRASTRPAPRREPPPPPPTDAEWLAIQYVEFDQQERRWRTRLVTALRRREVQLQHDRQFQTARLTSVLRAVQRKHFETALDEAVKISEPNGGDPQS
jgi:hypothetical protein